MPKEPVRIPVAEYMPDLPPLDNPGTATVLNVLPKTKRSYGPFPSPAVYVAGPLNLRCQGAVGIVDQGDHPFIFAGDAQDLYEIATGATAPSVVSKSTHPYTIAADQFWNFLLFGQRVVAANGNDPLQSFILNSSTLFADLAYGGITALTLVGGTGYTNGTYPITATGGGGSGFAGTVTVAGGSLSSYAITNPGQLYSQTSPPTIAVPAGAGAGTGGSITPTVATIAPKARYAAIMANFLMTAFTTDPVNGTQSQRAWWSALNDPTNWPTPGTAAAVAVQSSFNDLYGEGGACTGLVGNLGNADGAVFQEHAIWRVIYAGGANTFNFLIAEGARGTTSPGSIAKVGGNAYYIGDDLQFYRFDGAFSTPIGTDRVAKFFAANADQTNLHRICAGHDPVNKLVLWAIPFVGNVNGNPDHILAYNYEIDRWTLIQVTVEFLFRALSFGYTLDQLGTVLGFTLDTIPAPLDSPAWAGGALILAAFDTSHKLNSFTGAPLAPQVETAEAQLSPGKRTFIRGARPLVDSTKFTVAIARRDRLADTPVYSAATATNALGICPQRNSGRYQRALLAAPAGTVFTYIQGIEPEFEEQGFR